MTASLPPLTSNILSYRPLHIALLGYRSHPHVGGQGIYLKRLSHALIELGHQVDVISGPPYPELDPRVKLIRLPSLDLYAVLPHHIRALRWSHWRSWSDLFEWWTMATGGFAEPYTFGRRLVRHLRRGQPSYDVIHDNQSLCFGLLKLQRLGLPVVATVHHPITRDKNLALLEAQTWGQKLLIRRWYSFLSMQKAVVQQLNHLITVSACSREDIAQAFACDADKIRVIHNGMDTALFRPLTAIAKVPLRIMTTSSSDQALKGFTVLLEALAQLRQRLPQVSLRVIGQLQPNGRSQRLLETLRLQDAVSFVHGLTDEQLVAEYAQAEVAVCPSLYEGFGLPATEAMSCGVPLVSSNGGALAEVVADGGILVAAGNASEMAEALYRVLTTPSLAATLREKGRQRALTGFSWSRVAADLVDYYRQTVVPKPSANDAITSPNDTHHANH